jgi:hypothetical protein
MGFRQVAETVNNVLGVFSQAAETFLAAFKQADSFIFFRGIFPFLQGVFYGNGQAGQLVF